jgi:hypothetical protein
MNAGRYTILALQLTSTSGKSVKQMFGLGRISGRRETSPDRH